MHHKDHSSDTLKKKSFEQLFTTESLIEAEEKFSWISRTVPPLFTDAPAGFSLDYGR